MLLYAVTIFLSAFLLFQVQPMIAKIILPWFGGSAAVWTTCMLFFQIVLLGGYFYAHCVIRYLKPRQQVFLHMALLAVSLALLPIAPSGRWKPVGDADPTLGILGLLTATIGLPYLLLSVTSPLLQGWYVQSNHGAIPYRLFALSNFGSMLALLSFPIVIEPMFATRHQTLLWSGCYTAFVLVCLATAWRSRTGKQVHPAEIADASSVHPGFAQHLLWVALAACPSALLLSVTTHLTQNVALIPLLWVLPLSIYLLTFILCFERERTYHRGIFLPLLALSLGFMAFSIYYDTGNMDVKKLVPTYLAALFVCCMVCHGELARRKPHPRYLTSYYLMVSVGGAVGGSFVALVAPYFFHAYLELPAAMAVCAILAVIVMWSGPFWRLDAFVVRVLLVAATLSLIVYLAIRERSVERDYRVAARNFYGLLRVRDEGGSTDPFAYRELVHGTINHGEQLLDTRMRDTPTSYYGLKAGVGRAIKAQQQEHAPVRVGVIGLGAGVLASYCRAGDTFRFYEINPLVMDINRAQFTFFTDCAADKQILLGDARLTLERQPPQQFDVLVVDAFSSDAIPVHLLTREAFSLYFRHLKPDGILAVHISNKYLDLEPVVARDAETLHASAVVIEDEPDEDYLSSTTWVLLSHDSDQFNKQPFASADMRPAKSRATLRTWTDDYSNLFQILK